MSSKKQRVRNADDTLTKVFLGMLFLAVGVGVCSQAFGLA